MKRLIIILGFVLTIIMAGVFYGKIARPAEVETIKTDHYVYMKQFPVPMPDFTLMLNNIIL